jgi:oligosaccharyltransferase complex subunit alpha (ribophorin I)
MKFVDHIFDDQIVDHLTVKIILPEGSTNLKLTPPYPVKRDADQLHYTYLDTVGRPVVTLHKSNLVENHIQDFTLQYTFHRYMLFQEPFLVVGTFYLLFVLVIIYVRLDFSISKDEASESRMRTASLIEQVQGLHDRRSALYQTYEDAINKYKASKEQPTFTANKKKIDGDHKALTQQVTGLQQQLKGEGSDAAEKIVELQKLDTGVREQLQLAMQAAEKLVAGRLGKQQYVEQETVIRAKRDELCVKMDAIVATL